MNMGQVVAGRYRLNRILGRGGMATVWAATNIFTDREFAVKFMHPNLARTPEAAHRFLKEAKVSARVGHPNIIEVIDVGQSEDGSLFMVMELLVGQSLEAALKQSSHRMSVRDFTRVLLEVARALAAAHEKGVIHRDLKPTNIFLHQAKGKVVTPKLLDFGVSKFLEEDHNTALTMAGTLLGSPLYMSPEQARGELKIDGRTDVFSFGAILFEGLCGFRPYDAPSFNALLVAVATGQPKNIDAFAPDLPKRLRALVSACMATQKEARPASFDVVASELEACVAELGDRPRPLPKAAESSPVVGVSVASGPYASGFDAPPVSGPWSTPPPGAKTAKVRGTNSRLMAIMIGAAAGLVVASAAFLVVSRERPRLAAGASFAAAPAPKVVPSPAPSTSAVSVGSLPAVKMPAEARATER